MLREAMYTTILTLYKCGKSERAIARTVGHSRNTIRKIIKQYKAEGKESPVDYKRADTVSVHHDAIIKYLNEGLSGVRIHQELIGHGIGYSALMRYIRKARFKEEICIRFHTEAGEEAQVDFGEIGKQYDATGKKRKAYVFNMRLSYSRLDYYEVVFDQTVETFIKCHEHAFRYFGGVPTVVKIDNLKSAVVEAYFYEPLYQKVYKRFSEHYGFHPMPCRVYKPQEKGKVESGIGYVKKNFFKGRQFTCFSEMTTSLGRWLEETCNSRIHGTTKEKPLDLFLKEEKQALKTVPIDSFSRLTWCKRKVQKDCHITVEQSYYSVPYRYVNQEVEVEIGEKLVGIYQEGECIAVHPRSQKPGTFRTFSSHYPEYKLHHPKATEYQEDCKTKMKAIGEKAVALFCFIVEKRPHDWYRPVKGILSLQKVYSNEVIEQTCQRALHFSVVNYRQIKTMANQGYYRLPLPEGESHGSHL